MVRFFTIFLFLIPFLTAQDKQSILSYPQAVVWNTPFEISLITSTQYSEADKLEIAISANNRIDLYKAELNTFYGSSDIQIIDDYPEYKAVIDLKKNSLTGDMNYQVLFGVTPGDAEKVVLRFSGHYLKGDSAIGSLFEGEGNSKIAGIELYKSKKYPGKAIHLKENDINFVIKKLENNYLTADFWFRTPEKDFSLLKFYNREKLLTELFINTFGMLSLQSEFQNRLLNPYFISQNSWNHILLHADFREGTYNFYCNGSLVSSSLIDQFIKPENIRFTFGGENSKEYYLDQLKFSGADEAGVMKIIDGMHFTTSPDDIDLIRIFRFDNDNISKGSGNFSLSYNNLKFVKSDAPLTLRAPELNINVLSSSFELEWNEGDYKQAQQYVLERSENNKEFVPVYTISAQNDPDAKYRYTDRKSKNSEIIYYRVKQLLKDGSPVYSSQVKVGQGISEAFLLDQNFPNPFNPRTTIDIELFRDSDVEVLIYNLEGKEVSRLFDGSLAKGRHKFAFDGSELPSGVYICRVNTPDFSQTTKMILTK
jgi:hypothetical protein